MALAVGVKDGRHYKYDITSQGDEPVTYVINVSRKGFA